jgi:hypothetical protein
MFYVPVVDLENKPLMPTTILRARRWIKSGKATPFYKKGVFCVRLNVKPSDNKMQDIVVGIDTGSKREAYTIKSESHTYVNILSGTPYWIKDSMTQRRILRKSRRFNKTRYREARFNNRTSKKLAPSTRARWQLKLNMCLWLKKMFPITHFIVEDIKAKTIKNAKKWNTSFSPLEYGKNWFYTEMKKLGKLYLKNGWETKELRDSVGLKKSKSKLADKFECHNVDSWVLANYMIGGHILPDNKKIIHYTPIRFHRRQLHMIQFAKGGIRQKYGGTRSLGFKRGSLVKNVKYGLCYVGGTSNERISVHCIKTGKRLAQNIKVESCKFKTYLSNRRTD